MNDPQNHRSADHPIDPMFLQRWSPRAFTAETISEEELLTIMEAGRWAASSGNAQPWRFLYARRGTPAWETFVDLLMPGNQSWAQHASAIICLLSRTTRTTSSGEEVPLPTHAFDTGTASGYMALQAHLMGWFAHGMAGFHRDRLIEALGVPEGYRPEACYAIGRRGDPADLPEALRDREQPSDRRSLAELAFEGRFPPGG